MIIAYDSTVWRKMSEYANRNQYISCGNFTVWRTIIEREFNCKFRITDSWRHDYIMFHTKEDYNKFLLTFT